MSLTLVLVAVSGRADDAKKEGAKGDDCYQFVAGLGDIMEVMDGVFSKLPERLKAGKWKELKRESLFVAEVANLASHAKENHGNPEWLGFLNAMKANAIKMAEAAAKKDEAGVKASHSAVEKSCDSCHEKFRDN